jgi:hypothetical protein
MVTSVREKDGSARVSWSFQPCVGATWGVFRECKYKDTCCFHQGHFRPLCVPSLAVELNGSFITGELLALTGLGARV